MVGALIGLAGSLLPSLMKLWQDRQDKKHELEIMKLQIEREEKGHHYKMEEIALESESRAMEALYKMSETKNFQPLGYKWADIVTRLLEVLLYVYRSVTQPTVTYILLAYYGMTKYAQYKSAVIFGSTNYEALSGIWTSFDYELLSFAITFWFGGRLFQRAGQYKEK